VPLTIDDILDFADQYDAPGNVDAIFEWDVSDIFYNYFFVGNYRDCKNYPTHYDADIYGRIKVMSKNATYQGKCFMTSMIEYTEYTEKELRNYFEKEFNKVVLPPIFIGKKYILDNLNSLYSLTLNKEQVLSKLQA
ncbi:MAG: hypothetical protein IKI99_04350, partial [Firmicutes bacterium]|nr:hypothetical protein [Bacillota bacterium]